MTLTTLIGGASVRSRRSEVTELAVTHCGGSHSEVVVVSAGARWELLQRSWREKLGLGCRDSRLKGAVRIDTFKGSHQGRTASNCKSRLTEWRQGLRRP